MDLSVHRGNQRYAVEIKSSQGRADRVVPLLAQAILQAQTLATQERGAAPLAVVYVDHVSPALLRQVMAFAERFAPHVAFGIVSEEGPIISTVRASMIFKSHRARACWQTRARQARSRDQPFLGPQSMDAEGALGT